MSAWVSPCRTTRSIPFRIGLPSTVASSFSIWSVAGWVISTLLRYLDQDVIAFHLGREDLDRLRRRERRRGPRVEVERRAVLGALDRLVLDVDLALVQEVVRVRADRVRHAEPLVAEVRDREGPVVELEPPHLAFGDVVHAADAYEAHRSPLFLSGAALACGSAPPPNPRLISRSLASSRPSRISAMSTRSSTSA